MSNPGCRGSTKTLTGPEGIISITQTEYVHFMSCRWTIQVDPSEVLNNIQIYPNINTVFVCEFVYVTVCICNIRGVFKTNIRY